jgi:two-component system, NarL family, response regulator NreC
MAKLRVFLADDHAVLRDGLVLLINSQQDMEVVGMANDGHDLLQQTRDCSPDVVVIDISMPYVNGIQATEQLLAACPEMAVVVLTRHSEPGYMRQLLAAGARGYVLKQAAAQQLLDAIRVLNSGGVYIDPTLSAPLMKSLTHTREVGALLPELSAREMDVVRLLAQGYANKEIAAQLDLSVKTVDTYKARAMEKLGLYSRAELVRYALHRGWLDLT